MSQNSPQKLLFLQTLARSNPSRGLASFALSLIGLVITVVFRYQMTDGAPDELQVLGLMKDTIGLATLSVMLLLPSLVLGLVALRQRDRHRGFAFSGVAVSVFALLVFFLGEPSLAYFGLLKW